MGITTNDQKLYEVDGKLKAEIDVYITRECGELGNALRDRHGKAPKALGIHRAPGRCTGRREEAPNGKEDQQSSIGDTANTVVSGKRGNQ